MKTSKSFISYLPYAAFTHAGLTTTYRKKNLYKSILCCQGHAMY